MKTILLAADVVNGVTKVEEIPAGAQVHGDDFADYLKDHQDGVIYGAVSEEVAEQIDQEYGIH